MNEKDQVYQLERRVAQLQKHVTEQDSEMFRLSKRVDSLLKKCEKLESRLAEGSSPSPIIEEADAIDEKPPHY